jgi:small-conductance mechanosensitive channel
VRLSGGGSSPIRRFALALCAGAILSGAAPEPAAPPTETAPQAPSAVPLEEAAAQVEQVWIALDEIKARSTRVPEIARIQSELPGRAEALRLRSELDAARMQAETNADELQALRERWQGEHAHLARWDAALTERARDVGNDLQGLASLEATWTQTLAEVRRARAPQALAARVGEALREIAGTRRLLESRRAELLTAQNQVAQLLVDASQMSRALEDRQRAQRTALFYPDRLPIWSIEPALPDFAQLRARFASWWKTELDDAALYWEAHARSLPILLAAALAIVAALTALRRRARAHATEHANEFLGALERPFSAALLTTLYATPLWFANAPALVRHLIALTMLPAALRFGLRIYPARVQPLIWVLVAFFSADRLRYVLQILPLERWMLLLETAAALIALAWIWRRPLLLLSEQPPRRTSESLALRSASALLTAALLANLLGYVRLSSYLAGITLFASYFALVTAAAVVVLRAGFSLFMDLPAAGALAMLRRHHASILRRGLRLIGWVGVLGWSAGVLTRAGLLAPLSAAISRALAATLELGQVRISIGGVLTFALSAWLSLQLSRLVRTVLEDEVFPRAVVPRGVPHAVSTLAGYVVLLVGLITALAAAGINVGQLTLIVGALGIGIGFGLQNVVNDYVAGIILLFERNLHIGDTVQTGDQMAVVRRIGLRASVLRTFDGSEVVLPNSALTSSQITNWTLSDRRRRIDIRVGVAYGTETRRVLELLSQIARAHPAVLQDPAPLALFEGFGESSLDFRLLAWTGEFDESLRVRSELSVEVHARLRAEGIEIPFPQRDLHLRSVDPKIGLPPPVEPRGS